MKRCPNCGCSIVEEREKCPFCGINLPSTKRDYYEGDQITSQIIRTPEQNLLQKIYRESRYSYVQRLIIIILLACGLIMDILILIALAIK